MTKYLPPAPRISGLPKVIIDWFTLIYKGRIQNISSQTVELFALSSDPSDPPTGAAIQWVSDGTDSGDDGDIMIKITDSGGTTKTTTLVDYSAI